MHIQPTIPASRLCSARLSRWSGAVSLALVLCLAHGQAGAGSGFKVLHTFTSEEGSGLNGQLVEGADGRLYGTATQGGSNNKGTVFRVTTRGKAKLLHSFIRGKTGEREPTSGLVIGADGLFYGTAPTGGVHSGAGDGGFYTVTPTGDETLVHSFQGGAGDASVTYARPLLASDGNFYGTSAAGGSADEGTVYRITPAGEVTVLHSFTGGPNDGRRPLADLIEASDGNFYGTTYWGGRADEGIVFRMTPDGTVTPLHHFGITGSDGIQPSTALVQGLDGFLYGTTSWSEYDSKGQGAIYRISLAGEYTLLHTFPDGGSKGSEPEASLVQAANGHFYGSTLAGGAHDCGVLFRLSSGGGFSVLHHVAYAEGCRLRGALLQASDGFLYGTTEGRYASGTLFRLKAD